MSDLYGRLGLNKSASADEIKRAYRKEALTKHPDRGGKKEEFQGLQEAYDVLSDPDKRAYYDTTGQMPGSGSGPGTGSDMGFGFGGGGMPDLSAMFGSMFPGGVPFFGQNFGQGNGHGQGHRMKAARGPNKIHEIGVGLADLYKGKTFKLNMKRDTLCSGCNGKGGARMESCNSCGGKGFRVRGQQMGPIMAMTQEACATCAQTGQRVAEECGVCKGKRVTESESVLDVVIEPGMKEGDRLTFVGQCSESPQFNTPGDVILVIRSATTDAGQWVRSGNDLTCEVQLTLAEALLGWGRQIERHPSGRPLHIVWKNGVVREGEVLRITGWGMPVHSSGKLGDLRLVCRVQADQGAWSEEQQRALMSVWPTWIEPVIKEDSVVPSRPLA